MPVKSSYFLIDKFWDIFWDETSSKRLSICKNVDKYNNIIRFFYAWIVLFLQDFYYDKCKTVFCSTTPTFKHFVNKKKRFFYHFYSKTYTIKMFKEETINCLSYNFNLF